MEAFQFVMNKHPHFPSPPHMSGREEAYIKAFDSNWIPLGPHVTALKRVAAMRREGCLGVIRDGSSLGLRYWELGRGCMFVVDLYWKC